MIIKITMLCCLAMLNYHKLKKGSLLKLLDIILMKLKGVNLNLIMIIIKTIN